ncbi:MAG: hypothetical protein CMM15_05690 [Rhodospirillaceae bacterium]|nr:hypothetical protein [Rhodospirillaceae bacterium]|tara:strand:- start:50 stop:985 length:936 start_codon:yes stop_codon:yes gene_type:complete
MAITSSTSKRALDQLKKTIQSTNTDGQHVRNFNLDPERRVDSCLALLVDKTVPQISLVSFAINNIGSDGFGSTPDKNTVATRLSAGDGGVKHLVVTQWQKLFPKGVILTDIASVVSYLITIALLEIPLDNIEYNQSKGDSVAFLSTIAAISLATAELEVIEEFQKEIKVIQNQWHELQKKIIDDPMFVKHSEKLKELFVNAKSSLLNFVSTHLENSTTLGAAESSPASENQDKLNQKGKEISHHYVEFLDMELTANLDTITHFLFEKSTNNINSLLEIIFRHYIYHNLKTTRGRRELRILSEIITNGHFDQ